MVGILSGEKTEIGLRLACESISKMLVGAYLDCFSVSSIVVSLKFVNGSSRKGHSLYVESEFSCDAVIGVDDNFATDYSQEDFFTRRAKFLSDIYSLIGMEVTKINLGVDGSLSIVIGESIVFMKISEDDGEEGDSAWKVEMEASAGHIVSAVSSVVCVQDDGGVSFFSWR